jgi:hypothetical protein
MMVEHMLTTVDNPYSPVTDFDQWYAWDHRAGYDTPSYLARVVRSSDELSEADQSSAQEQAIDDVVRENPGFYIKVPVTTQPIS